MSLMFDSCYYFIFWPSFVGFFDTFERWLESCKTWW